MIDEGAPRPGWNPTFHGPLTVATAVSVTAGATYEDSEVGLRNITKTVPHGSRCNGTVVRPFTTLKEAASVVAVSARHNSGRKPATRNVASSDSSWSLRLSTK